MLLPPDQQYRKEHGLCIDCGVILTKRECKEGYIRCPACRTEKLLKAETDRTATAAPPRTLCQRCVWVTYVGEHRWFCPFPHCVPSPRYRRASQPAGKEVQV